MFNFTHIQATISKSADNPAIGRYEIYGAINKIETKIKREWTIEDSFVVPPEFIFATVLAIALQLLEFLKNGTTIFVIPWPINSLFGSVLFPVIPSLITAHKSDSKALILQLQLHEAIMLL